MGEGPRVNVKVERGSTFTLNTRELRVKITRSGNPP